VAFLNLEVRKVAFLNRGVGRGGRSGLLLEGGGEGVGVVRRASWAAGGGHGGDAEPVREARGPGELTGRQGDVVGAEQVAHRDARAHPGPAA
jgi:hypothetical protein